MLIGGAAWVIFISLVNALVQNLAAYRWGIFRDTEVANRGLEIFLVNSWAEHLRQHAWQTQSDPELEERIFSYFAAEPVVRHLIYTYHTRRKHR